MSISTSFCHLLLLLFIYLFCNTAIYKDELEEFIYFLISN
jgi:hypothetical protein